MLELLEKNSDETAKQYAFRVLMHNIVALNLKPGEKIIENELCEHFNISRTPIREAILELRKQSMIDIYPKQGTYVSLIDTHIIEEFLGMRSLLESEVAKIACDTLTDDDLKYLKTLTASWDYYAHIKDTVKMLYYDNEFHKHIYHSANKHFWYKIIRNNAPQFDRMVTLMQNVLPTDFLYEDHMAMIEAFSNHDKDEAYALTMTHTSRYYGVKHYLKEFYNDYFTDSSVL